MMGKLADDMEELKRSQAVLISKLSVTVEDNGKLIMEIVG